MTTLRSSIEIVVGRVGNLALRAALALAGGAGSSLGVQALNVADRAEHAAALALQHLQAQQRDAIRVRAWRAQRIATTNATAILERLPPRPWCQAAINAAVVDAGQLS